MILFIGPLYGGQEAAAASVLAEQGRTLTDCRVADLTGQLQTLSGVQTLTATAKALSDCDAVLTLETGCGMVPLSEEERMLREAVGALNRTLATFADEVYRVVAGIPVKIN